MQGTLLWLSVASLALSSQNSQASPAMTEQVVSPYYARPQVKDCEKFNLSVNLNLILEKDNGTDVYMLTIKVLYRDSEQDGTMSILDIGLPTGFIADSRDLDAMSKGEIDRGLSTSDTGSSIIIYLDKVSHVRPEEIAFRITQRMKVGVLQPAAVSIHEYDNQKPCLRFYHPERTQARLLQLCYKKEDVRLCTCADVRCSKLIKGKISNGQRFDMACKTETKYKVDYVYKVRVESRRMHEEDDSTAAADIYHMRIVTMLKEGRTDLVVEQQLREFISPPHCNASLGLQTGKTYLIMGVQEDVHGNADNLGYQYVLGEKTWIEYWPSTEECQSYKYRRLCLGMQRLEDQLTLFGCPD